MEIKKNGIYLLKDEFFEKYDNESFKHLIYNKKESRPHFYLCLDRYNKDIYWVIPLTSNLKKVNENIERFKSIGKETPYYVVDKRESNSAFNIGGIFPIVKNYIAREFIDKNTNKHLIIKNTALLKEIEKKSKYMINKNMRFNEFIKRLYSKLELELEEKESF